MIGQQPNNIQQLIASILYYAFSFVILISIWRSYTRTMYLLPAETNNLINLNILLLFLVSIEPYIFNQLIGSPSLEMLKNVSIVYAFDLGGLFIIQAFFANSLVNRKKLVISEDLIREYKFRRYTLLAGAVIFLISTLPLFWTWSIELSSSIPVRSRLILWFIPLFSPLFVRLWERKNRKSNHQNIS